MRSQSQVSEDDHKLILERISLPVVEILNSHIQKFRLFSVFPI